jgi:hypothetical protein
MDFAIYHAILIHNSLNTHGFIGPKEPDGEKAVGTYAEQSAPAVKLEA